MTTIERLKELEELKKESRELNRELTITLVIVVVCIGTAAIAFWAAYTVID